MLICFFCIIILIIISFYSGPSLGRFKISSETQVPNGDPLFKRFNPLQIQGTPVEKCIQRCTKETIAIPEDNLPPKYLFGKDPSEGPKEIERKLNKFKPEHSEQALYFHLLRAIKSYNLPCLILSGYKTVDYLKREKDEAKQDRQNKVGYLIRKNTLMKPIVAQN